MTSVVDLEPDGRVLRGERNREAIVDALLALYDDRVLRPSVHDVAERAGVSARSVHNHFADMEALRAEVAERQFQRYAHLWEPPPAELRLDARISQLVDRRAALFEAITPVRRAAMLSVHDSPAIARRLGRVGRMLRGQLATLFAAELEARDAETLDAIDLCASWDAWDRLRTQQRLTITGAKRVVVTAMRVLLEP